MKYLVLILVAIVKEVFSYNCPVYRCAKTKIDDIQCINYTPNNVTLIDTYDIDLSHCGKNTYCPNEIAFTKQSLGCSNKTASKESESTVGLDTQPCVKDDDCKSGVCSKEKKCEGKKTGDICREFGHASCKIGLYCNLSNLCSPQEVEKAKCRSDVDCENDLGCNGPENDKICVKYYSLPPNAAVYGPNERRFCASNFAKDGICVEHTLIDEDICKGGQTKCRYTYMKNGEALPVSFTQDCGCSGSNYNEMYCPLGVNSKNWGDMVKSYRSYYESVKTKHTTLRNFFSNEVLVNQLKIEQYPKIRDADDCYFKYMTPGFYNVIKASMLAMISILILML